MIGKRRIEVGTKKQWQLLIHFENEKTARNDAWLPMRSKELRPRVEYLDTFESTDGHVEDDVWQVEYIKDERSTGKEKEYYVKWAGWPLGHEPWVQKANVEPTLVAAWQAAKAARAAMAAHFSDEERFWARRHAVATIGLIQSTLLQQLRGARKEAARRALVQLKACDDWLYKAIYAHIVDAVPQVDLASYITPVKQIVGVTGTTASIAYEFHIVSGAVLPSLFPGEQEGERRIGHVILRDNEPATALGLLTPLTFRRSGPRDDPAKQVLRITAGIGALADRPELEPDWRFDDAEPAGGKDAARLFISQALLKMEERQPGTVSANIQAECHSMVASRGVK